MLSLSTAKLQMLSSRAKYALRACVLLAERQPEQEWVLSPDIAEAEDIPRKFLEAILVELRDNGFVESRRGRRARLLRAARLRRQKAKDEAFLSK